MRRNNYHSFNPHQYEKHLSPFGRKVLETLIKQRNADRECNRNRSFQQSQRRVITFGEPNHYNCRVNDGGELNLGAFNDDDNSSNAHIVQALPQDSQPQSALSETVAVPMPPTTLLSPPFVFRTSEALPSFPPQSVLPTLPIPTSAELVTPAKNSTPENHISFSRDDLITSVDCNIVQAPRNIIEKTGHEADKNIGDVIDKARSVRDECRNTTNISWDNMFDTELLPEVDQPCKTVVNKKSEKIFNIQFPTEKSRIDILNDDKNKRKKDTIEKKVKRKVQAQVTDTIPKKVKKVKTEDAPKRKTLPNNKFRKEKYTDSVNTWLNDVDPSNPVAEYEILEVQISKPKVVVEKSPPKKPVKKIVQAQLANKGGIMKYRKPKNDNEIDNDKNNSKTSTNNSTDPLTSTENKTKDKDDIEENKSKASFAENKSKEKDKGKDKKSKLKFIAPIKSQLPVKDISYEIKDVDDTNARNLKLGEVCDQEIIALLLYSNGFSQLNSQHTDDACLPDAVIFHVDDDFFYVRGDKEKVTEVVRDLLKKNTLICYDGKSLLIYLMSKLDLGFQVTRKLTIIDVKIAGTLLEPDNPPESFTALQRLSCSEPQYTVATTCARQKAAWYATLLSATAGKIRDQLNKEDLWQVFVDIEMSILPIIADMEHRGVKVDTEKLKEMETVLVGKMKQVEAECVAAAGRPFQINSPVQVRALLYDELKLDERAGLKVRETISTQAKSTSETMLRSLVSLHPLPRLILEYRHLHKAHATFVQGVAQYVRAGIVRPVWVQTAAATGRIASSNPNLQAIPKVPFSLTLFPTENSDSGAAKESLRFRSVYVARAGYVLLVADWRHVECRVFARAADDKKLQQALTAPDLFTRLAADWLKKPEQDVCPADRERTKRIVYASLYGAGPRKLMDILDVDYAQALSIASSFDRTFPSLRSFGRVVSSRCRESGGRVETLCGRARKLAHVSSADPGQRAHAERQALNFIVQGSAADVCKLAMAEAVRALGERGSQARLLLQIHDELVWEIPEQELHEAAEVIRSAMESCGSRAGLPVLPVALAAGPSWGELAPYPPDSSDNSSIT